jgi:hypothetical protein
MKSIIRYGTAAAAFAAALTMAPMAYSADNEVVKITPDTKAVGVYRGDTVKFIDQQTDQSFTRTFQYAHSGVDLNQFAPASALGSQHVKVYVWDQSGEAKG